MQALKIGLITPLLAAALAVLPTTVAAQVYPAKAVRWVIPFPPGGGTDLISRTLTQKLSEAWGVQVIADNRPGAGGTTEQFAAFVRTEIPKWAKVVKDSGAKVD